MDKLGNLSLNLSFAVQNKMGSLHKNKNFHISNLT